MKRSSHRLWLSAALAAFSLLLTLVSLAQADAVQVLTAEDLQPFFIKALSEFAPWDPAEMEVRDISLYPSTVTIPKGDWRVEAQPPPGSRFLGRVTFLMTIVVNGRPEKRVRMAGYVEVYRDVLCTASALKRGHILTDADFVTVRRPLSRLRGKPVVSIKAAVGMALRRSVSAGQVVTESLLTPPVVVRRGDRVTILAKSPWLEIKAPGEARQNGAKGELIRVKNLMSKKEITAEVIDATTVAVRF